VKTYQKQIRFFAPLMGVLQLFANVMALAHERNTTNMSAKKGLSEKTGIVGT
jgi:hypothetical protein